MRRCAPVPSVWGSWWAPCCPARKSRARLSREAHEACPSRPRWIYPERCSHRWQLTDHQPAGRSRRRSPRRRTPLRCAAAASRSAQPWAGRRRAGAGPPRSPSPRHRTCPSRTPVHPAPVEPPQIPCRGPVSAAWPPPPYRRAAGGSPHPHTLSGCSTALSRKGPGLIMGEGRADMMMTGGKRVGKWETRGITFTQRRLNFDRYNEKSCGQESAHNDATDEARRKSEVHQSRG